MSCWKVIATGLCMRRGPNVFRHASLKYRSPRLTALPVGMPMESRADAGAPATRTELLPGRLVFEQVAMALLAEYPSVQSVLATCVGSFVYSIVGLDARLVSAYGPQGRALLCLSTLANLAVVRGDLWRARGLNREALELAQRHGRDWLQQTRAADRRSSALGGTVLPLTWKATDASHPIDFAGYAYTRTPSDVSGASMTHYDESTP